MVRLVDRFALVGVGALVGEVRFHLGARESWTNALFHCLAELDFFVIAAILSSFCFLRRLLTRGTSPLRCPPWRRGGSEVEPTLLWMKLSETAMVPSCGTSRS